MHLCASGFGRQFLYCLIVAFLLPLLSGCINTEEPLIARDMRSDIGERIALFVKDEQQVVTAIRQSDNSYIQSDLVSAEILGLAPKKNLETSRFSVRILAERRGVYYAMAEGLDGEEGSALFVAINKQNKIRGLILACDSTTEYLARIHSIIGECSWGSLNIKSPLPDREELDCFLSDYLAYGLSKEGNTEELIFGTILGFGSPKILDKQLRCDALASNYDAPRTRRALVVGNSGYRSLPWLPNPRNDAEAVASALAKIGFEVMLLVDGDFVSTQAAIREFSASITKGLDVALIYYSGHAIEQNGRNYLLPVDATDRDRKLVGTTELLAAISPNVAARILVLDACRENPFGQKNDSGLTQMDAGAGTLIAFSTAPGRVAVDGDPEAKMSPYTSALVAALQSPAKSVDETFQSVRMAVLSATHGSQVPWENSSLTRQFSFQMFDYGEVSEIVRLSTDSSGSALEFQQ